MQLYAFTFNNRRDFNLILKIRIFGFFEDRSNCQTIFFFVELNKEKMNRDFVAIFLKEILLVCQPIEKDGSIWVVPMKNQAHDTLIFSW